MADPWRPPEVEERYRHLLEAVDRAGLPPHLLLTSHWPLVGTAPRRLLIVGQAVYGWIPSWRPRELQAAGGIERVIAEAQQACYDRVDPMNWILESRVRSSPFWRTTRKLVELTVSDTEHDWYSHVAWANIYPIARNDVKGNPEGELRDSQTDPAAALLDAVARALRPQAVIVLGGSFWWDVAPQLTLAGEVAVERPLLAAGSRDGVPWIVGWHPGGAQRRGWGADRYAAVIRDFAAKTTMRG